MNFMFRLDKPLPAGLYKFNGQNQVGFEIVKPADCIKRVIFNDPATIVIWSDDSKTVVKCENEAYDPEKGLAMCIAKRAMGNNGNYYNLFKKFLPKKEQESVVDSEQPKEMTSCEKAMENLKRSLLASFSYGGVGK